MVQSRRISDSAGRTSDPPAALRNLLERDLLFTERLRAATRQLRLTTVEVAHGMTEDGLAEQIARLVGLRRRTP